MVSGELEYSGLEKYSQFTSAGVGKILECNIYDGVLKKMSKTIPTLDYVTQILIINHFFEYGIICSME